MSFYSVPVTGQLTKTVGFRKPVPDYGTETLGFKADPRDAEGVERAVMAILTPC
ncbi:MAG: hypothetical protein U9N87_13975 [Planctomycetota bacterium]|nr:hypothetical protein [Planctomycetota bacterium]